MKFMSTKEIEALMQGMIYTPTTPEEIAEYERERVAFAHSEANRIASAAVDIIIRLNALGANMPVPTAQDIIREQSHPFLEPNVGRISSYARGLLTQLRQAQRR
jgi:hypothetical protein